MGRYERRELTRLASPGFAHLNVLRRSTLVLRESIAPGKLYVLRMAGAVGVPGTTRSRVCVCTVPLPPGARRSLDAHV